MENFANHFTNMKNVHIVLYAFKFIVYWPRQNGKFIKRIQHWQFSFLVSISPKFELSPQEKWKQQQTYLAYIEMGLDLLSNALHTKMKRDRERPIRAKKHNHITQIRGKLCMCLSMCLFSSIWYCVLKEHHDWVKRAHTFSFYWTKKKKKAKSRERRKKNQ